jgi:hypothetical protein
MRMAAAVKKIKADFVEALPYWRDHFDTWVFVHNADGGLPPGVINCLLELASQHAPIKLEHWGFEELLQRFRLLSPEDMRSLYGVPPASDEKKASDARTKLKLAQELVHSGGKASEAIGLMKEALVSAKMEGNNEEEVEALVPRITDPRNMA